MDWVPLATDSVVRVQWTAPVASLETEKELYVPAMLKVWDAAEAPAPARVSTWAIAPMPAVAPAMALPTGPWSWVMFLMNSAVDAAMAPYSQIAFTAPGRNAWLTQAVVHAVV